MATMANIRTAMNLRASISVTKPVDLNDLEVTIDKTLETIAMCATSTSSAPALNGARANLARYFSPQISSTCWPRATSR